MTAATSHMTVTLTDHMFRIFIPSPGPNGGRFEPVVAFDEESKILLMEVVIVKPKPGKFIGEEGPCLPFEKEIPLPEGFTKAIVTYESRKATLEITEGRTRISRESLKDNDTRSA